MLKRYQADSADTDAHAARFAEMPIASHSFCRLPRQLRNSIQECVGVTALAWGDTAVHVTCPPA